MAKSIQQIYREHNSLDQETGKPLPGFVEHTADGCQCASCKAYLAEKKDTAE